MDLKQSFLESEAISEARERARMTQRFTGYTGSFHGHMVGNVKDDKLLAGIESTIYQEAQQHGNRRVVTPGKLLMTVHSLLPALWDLE